MCIGKNPLLSKYGLVEETSLYFKLKRLGTQLLLNDEIINLKTIMFQFFAFIWVENWGRYKILNPPVKTLGDRPPSSPRGLRPCQEQRSQSRFVHQLGLDRISRAPRLSTTL